MLHAADSFFPRLGNQRTQFVFHWRKCEWNLSKMNANVEDDSGADNGDSDGSNDDGESNAVPVTRLSGFQRLSFDFLNHCRMHVSPMIAML